MHGDEKIVHPFDLINMAAFALRNKNNPCVYSLHLLSLSRPINIEMYGWMFTEAEAA